MDFLKSLLMFIQSALKPSRPYIERSSILLLEQESAFFLLRDILYIAVPSSTGAHLLLCPVFIRHDMLGIERLRFSNTFRSPYTLRSMFEHQLIWSLSKLQPRSFNDATSTYLPPPSSITPRLLDSRLHDFRKPTQAGFDFLLTA